MSTSYFIFYFLFQLFFQSPTKKKSPEPDPSKGGNSKEMNIQTTQPQYTANFFPVWSRGKKHKPYCCREKGRAKVPLHFACFSF